MGWEWYGGWSGTGMEWYERTERKRRGVRALKRLNRDKNHKTAAVQKSCCRRIIKTKSIDIEENVNENLDNVFLWPR